MLEKAPGNIDVKKLRAILLLEAYFNAAYEIIFNRRMMPRFEEANTVPSTPAPVLVTNFMVTETNDFLMTEDDNNLITGTEII